MFVQYMRQLLKSLMIWFLWLILPLEAAEKPIILSEKEKPIFHNNQKSTVEYEVEKHKNPNEDFFLPRIEKIFANPSLIANLEKGADAINKSIESLMDSLFYSLLDNELKLDVSEFTWLSMGLSRRVFTTARGNYVVVDRFNFGPQLLKPISEIAGIPIYFGANGETDILEIYLRTDAQRIKESEESNWHERQVKNWFGILPFLTRVLPPSFNPNEMYDPLRQAKNPLTFPMTKESLKQMPSGSVRSYGISGGVSLPIDFASKQNEIWRNFFQKIGMKAQLPYGIFVTGQFRVNILKKSEDKIWIGLSQSNENGHTINPFLGGSYFLLQNAFVFVPWKGLLSQVVPIDVSYKNSLLSVFDQLFEFDLNEEKNTLALEDALKGNFAASSKLFADKNSGIIFHFNRTEQSLIDNQKTNHNFFVFQDSKEIRRKKSQIKTWDEKEETYSLEVEHIWSKDYWNLLVGKESVNLSASLEMKVKKEGEDENAKAIYSFWDPKEDPYVIRFGLQIDDKYTDIFDYRGYAFICRRFVRLPLKELVDIEDTNESADLSRSKKLFFTHPQRTVFARKAPIQTVGRFDSQGVVIFSSSSLSNLFLQKEEDLIEKLLELSTKDKNISKDQLHFVADKMKSLTKIPVHLISKYDLWEISLDQIKEVVASIGLIKDAKTPYDYQEAFHDLFKSAPAELILDLFYEYASLETVPRKINFDIKTNASLAPEVVLQLERASSVSFSSHKNFPKRQGYHIAKEKLEAFFPQELKDLRKSLLIEHLSISTKDEEDRAEPIIFVEMTIKDFPKDKEAQVYLKLEESGKLLLGKYVLGQTVLTLSAQVPPKNITLQPNETYFHFYLTGPKSPLSDFIFDQSMKMGGDFLLSLSLSEDGQVWSKEKTFRFNYSDRKLSPPNPEDGSQP